MTFTDLLCGAGAVALIVAAFGAFVSGMRMMDNDTRPPASATNGQFDPTNYGKSTTGRIDHSRPEPYSVKEKAATEAAARPCAASGPAPVCPNCKPKAKKQEPKQEAPQSSGGFWSAFSRPAPEPERRKEAPKAEPK